MRSEEENNRISLHKKVFKIEEDIIKKNNKETIIDKMEILDSIALATVFINPPVGIVIGLAAMVNSSLKENQKEKNNNQKLKTNKMPDEWLQEVAQSEFVSDIGLKFLTDKIQKNGFISVSDALEYIDIENENLLKVKKDKEIVNKGDGAMAILKKAELRLGSGYLNSCNEFITNKINPLNIINDKKDKAFQSINDGINFFKHNKKDQ